MPTLSEAVPETVIVPDTVAPLAGEVMVTVGGAGITPVPDRPIEMGEFDALLTTETLPVTPPAAAGAKVTFRVSACPGLTMVPADNPLALKPAPETLTVEIVTLELPEFVSIAGRTLLLPVFTLLKHKLV